MKERPRLASVLAAVALASFAQGCDQRFEFDVGRAGAGAGGLGVAGSVAVTGGMAPAGGMSGSASGGASNAAGGGGLAGQAGSGGVTTTCGSLAACSLGLHCADERCVQCANDLDCAAYGLPRCELTRHRCVACLMTADCADDFACDALANRCLQTCQQDGDCPNGAHGCDDGRQVCYQCDEDRECAASPLGSLCASDGSGCVQCRRDTDCSNQHCDQLTGRCVECRDGLDCASELCNPTTFSCSVN